MTFDVTIVGKSGIFKGNRTVSKREFSSIEEAEAWKVQENKNKLSFVFVEDIKLES